MKRFQAFVFLFLFLSAIGFAQEKFEGKVFYHVSISNNDSDFVDATIGTDYVYYFGENAVLFEKLNAAKQEQFTKILVKDTSGSFLINDNKKIYYTTAGKQHTFVPKDPAVSLISQNSKILDKACKQYQVTYYLSKGKLVYNIWVAKELPLETPDTEHSTLLGIAKKLKAVPLKISYYVEKNVKITIQATKIEAEKLDASIFSIPSGYQEKEFNTEHYFEQANDKK